MRKIYILVLLLVIGTIANGWFLTEKEFYEKVHIDLKQVVKYVENNKIMGEKEIGNVPYDVQGEYKNGKLTGVIRTKDSEMGSIMIEVENGKIMKYILSAEKSLIIKERANKNGVARLIIDSDGLDMILPIDEKKREFTGDYTWISPDYNLKGKVINGRLYGKQTYISTVTTQLKKKGTVLYQCDVVNGEYTNEKTNDTEISRMWKYRSELNSLESFLGKFKEYIDIY